LKKLLQILTAGVFIATFAHAVHADEIVLRADAPIVDVTINGKPARMLVDPFLPDMMALNPDTRTRLGVRPIPAVGARAAFDDASIRARIARPRLVFANGKSSRAFTGLFGEKWSDVPGVDGAMGPGVLPYDRVRIVLRDGAGGTVRTHRLAKREIWTVDSTLAGDPARVDFSLARAETMINRPLAQLMDEQRLLTPTGDVQRRAFFLGLSTTIQMSRTEARVVGLPMGTIVARTEAPLIGSDDVDVITVTADAAKPRPRSVTLGRDALASCYEFVWVRAAGTLSLRCDYTNE
jgi:hypothetical protein